MSRAPPSLKSDFDTVVTRGIVQLGVQLLRKVRRSAAAGGNVVLSPYAVASALEELMVGASGLAAKQIAAALRVPPGSRVSAYFFNRDRDMPSRDPTDGRKIFDMAYLNSINHDERVVTMDTSRFEEGEEEPVRLDRFRWNFADDSEKSRIEIDSYGRLIASAFEADEIMPKGSITPSSSVCFLSVLDFRGAWKLPFDDCTCTRGVFLESATVSSGVVMMHMTGHFRVAHSTDLMARALELPYQPPGHGGSESSTPGSSGTSTPSLHADEPASPTLL
ncbi:ipis-1-like [Haemaphysalis longicornis]